jgi:hypothetical protein
MSGSAFCLNRSTAANCLLNSPTFKNYFMKSIKERKLSPASATTKRSIKGKTVRGSGFTYTENEQRTDLSIPAEKADDGEIVELPDLGKKNRP